MAVGWPLGARPFRQNREKASHVRGDQPRVPAAQLATEARLPDLTGAADQNIIEVVVGTRCFHRRPPRADSLRSVLLAFGLGFTPMPLDLPDVHLGCPHRRGHPLKRAASTRQFILGNGVLVRFAGFNNKFAAISFTDLARHRVPKKTMMKPVEEHLSEAFQSRTELRPSRL